MTIIKSWNGGDYEARSEQTVIKEFLGYWNFVFLGCVLIIFFGIFVGMLSSANAIHAVILMVIGVCGCFITADLSESTTIIHPALKINLVKGKVDGREYEQTLFADKIMVSKDPEVLAERMSPVISRMDEIVSKDLTERKKKADEKACILKVEEEAIKRL
jgi:hypothetical protein